jgi:hypothetical protein
MLHQRWLLPKFLREQDFEEFFELLTGEEMDNYLESRVEYQKFEF